MLFHVGGQFSSFGSLPASSPSTFDLGKLSAVAMDSALFSQSSTDLSTWLDEDLLSVNKNGGSLEDDLAALLGSCDDLTDMMSTRGDEVAQTIGEASGLDSSSVGSCSPLSECRWTEIQEPTVVSSTNLTERKRPRRGTATNRAALSARQNRLKKKSYVEGLEQQVKDIDERNKRLLSVVNPLKGTIARLEKEVEYLKQVIRNDGMIASVLQNVPNLQQVKFSCPKATGDSRPADSDLDGKSSTTGGICLHVAGQSVNAMLCSSCSSMS